MTQEKLSDVERGKDRSRGWSNDMSPEAIWQRLQKVEQLYQAWLVLSRGKRVTEIDSPDEQPRREPFRSDESSDATSPLPRSTQ